MSFEFTLPGLAWLGIIIGAAWFMLGSMLWYSPPIFGNMWMQEEGLTQEDVQAGVSPKIYGSVFVMALVTNLAIALILGNIQDANAFDGLLVGLIIGVGIVAMILAPHYIFAGKSTRLTLIQMGHGALEVAVSGLIIGIMMQL